MLTTRISALLLCGALAACCLTGCGGKTAAPTAAPSGSAAVSSAGDGVYVPTEEGVYELQSISPGSANLFYTDAATKSRIFLCADPGCSHDSDRCTSYIATPGASFPPLLLRAGDGLLVFFAGTDEEAPRAMTMDFDGSNRRTAFTLSANQQPAGSFFLAGDRLYFDLMETGENGQNSYQLWCADLSAGKAEALLDLGVDGAYYALCGCAGDELCFQQVTEEGLRYCMYSIRDNKLEQPFYTDNSESGSSLVGGGYLFTLDETARTVTRLDLATGEQLTCAFSLKEGYGTPSLRYLFDGKLLLTAASTQSTGGSYDLCAYVLDFPAGSCIEMTLRTPFNDRPVMVLSQVGELCLVASDYRIDSGTGLPANVYAFLSRQDYLNSNPDGYLPVNDCV